MCTCEHEQEASRQPAYSPVGQHSQSCKAAPSCSPRSRRSVRKSSICAPPILLDEVHAVVLTRVLFLFLYARLVRHDVPCTARLQGFAKLGNCSGAGQCGMCIVDVVQVRLVGSVYLGATHVHASSKVHPPDPDTDVDSLFPACALTGRRRSAWQPGGCRGAEASRQAGNLAAGVPDQPRAGR